MTGNLYFYCKWQNGYIDVCPPVPRRQLEVLLYLTLSCLCSQEFAGEDTSDLFLEERETALRQAQEEKHKLQMSVPGILNPHEIPEEMCD